MNPRLAQALVFATSFCVLVLEILAGRLLAPAIGVSLETFTGIIGTVLAGIALGSALGGRLADQRDPARLLGPTLLLGGVSTWAAPVSASLLGPAAGTDPLSIVVLAAATFFVPAAVLSAVTPLVAKLQIRDLESTGRVVGSLSAAGTAGALAGTFVTGFVLVAAFPTRAVIVAVGLVLVIAGAVGCGWARLARNRVGLAAVAFLGVGAAALDGPCRAETAYACVQIVPDPDRPSGRSVVLNGDRNSYVDLEDPGYLEFRYMRLFASVSEALPAGPLQALHVGGAGFSFPRYLAHERPGTVNQVLEIDGGVVELARRELGLVLSSEMRVVTGDARLTLGALPPDGFDLVVLDAYSGLTVPWHLTTTEFLAAVDLVLAPAGIVTANLIDGGDLDFARAQLATYRVHFEHVNLIVPAASDAASDRARNLVVVASHQPIPDLAIAADDGWLLDNPATQALVGEAMVLVDDFAPVDQLRMSG
jgi:spermidine synthase